MEDILQEFNQGSIHFEEILHQFDQQQFNTKLASGSWTVGQVCEHVHKSDKAILISLHGPTEKTDRDPGEKIRGLRAIFLNFSHTLQSPEFIIPDDKEYEKEESIRTFKLIRLKLTEAFEKLDLSETCLTLPPELGHLTRLEVLHFVSVHTTRHIRQLEKIRTALAETENASSITR